MPSTVTSLAKVSCGSPRRSASIAGTTLIRASVDSRAEQHEVERARRPSIALASASEVASASEPCSASSSDVEALSAPIDSALRIVSVAGVRAHGEHGHLAAVRLLELQRLLDGVLVHLVHHGVVAARSSVLSTGSSFFSAQVSGTCFTQTTMFMRLPISYRDGCAHPASRRWPELRRVRSGRYVTHE